MKEKTLKRVNIREFSRRMYAYINDLPIEVYNRRTGTVVFIVIPAQKGGDISGTKDPVQSKRHSS
jgi:hypothetical protein